MTADRTESERAGQAALASERRPGGLIASVASGLVLLAVAGWQFAGVADDGLQVQVLDPGLHPIGKAVILASLGASTACSLVAWVRRCWTMPVAIVNAGADWAAAAAITALTSEGSLFASTLPTRVGAAFETTTQWSGLFEPFLLAVAGVALWDGLGGIQGARQIGAQRGCSRTH